ncbi:MAG: hypothetical protein NT040_19765, partial [Bacteroidetes bacterium]|nr:hypothetical protein [Bacteroidota bacterium]
MNVSKTKILFFETPESKRILWHFVMLRLRTFLLLIPLFSFLPGSYCTDADRLIPHFGFPVHAFDSDSTTCEDQAGDTLKRIARFDHSENGSSYFYVRLSLLHSEFERLNFFMTARDRKIFIADKNDFYSDSAIFFTASDADQAKIEFRELYKSAVATGLSLSEKVKKDVVRSSPFYTPVIIPESGWPDAAREGAYECSGADVSCSGNTYSFPAGTTGSAPLPIDGYPNYGCLSSRPCPAWYYMQVGIAGDIIIDISQSGGNDVDFICWGPFNSLTDGCATGLTGTCPKPGNPCCNNNDPPLPDPCIYPKGNITDCSYSGLATETCHILNAQVGEIYILLMTNYSQQPGTITFSQTGGAGVTNCNIVHHCTMIAITTNQTACEPSTNTFAVSGNIEFSNPPPTGTLTVTDSPSGISQVFGPPFTSPWPYSLPNIPCDGAQHFINALFSDSLDCIKPPQEYSSPPPTCPQSLIFTVGPQTICAGTLNVPISVFPDAGTQEYHFNYNPPQPEVTISQINPGDPFITISFSPTATSGFIEVYGTSTICPAQSATMQLAVTVNPLPNIVTSPASPLAICNNSPAVIDLSSSVPGTINNTTFSWSAVAVDPFSVSPAMASGTTSAQISQVFSNLTTTVQDINLEITSSSNNCPGQQVNYLITLNPTPTVATIANQTFCNGDAVPSTPVTSPVAGTTYTWTNNNTDIGLDAGGTGNISAFTAGNTGTTPIFATIEIIPTANGCVGTPFSFTIQVNPAGHVIDPADQVICNNAPTSVTFGTLNTGGTTTYSWANNTTSIGLGATGTGDITSFTSINTGLAPVIATVTVTPTFTSGSASCDGTPQAFDITVNPSGQVNDPVDLVVCNNAMTSASFSTTHTGGTTSYSWTNNTTSIGLGASGTGDIASFTATNTTTSPVIATVTVTPTFTNGSISCDGP